MWKTLKELLPNKKGDLNNLPTVSNSDMELANDFNEHFTNIGTASTPSSTSSRVYDHDRHGGNKFTFTKISIDQVVDELKAISQNKGSGLDGLRGDNCILLAHRP